MGNAQVARVRRDEARVVFLLLRFVAGRAVLCALRRAQVPPEVPDVVGVLPPIAQPLIGAQARAQFDDLARGVKQQADIGRVMHIGLNHEGVAAPTQHFAFLFSYHFVTGSDDDLVDLVQQLRCE